MKIYRIAKDFYRGTIPGEPQRIPTVFPSSEGKTFVARNIDSAKCYGNEIQTYRAKPSAKILYEESSEFWKLIGRRKPPNSLLWSALKKGETLVDAVDFAIKKAIENGYDAISFSMDDSIGTVILNNNAFSVM